MCSYYKRIGHGNHCRYLGYKYITVMVSRVDSIIFLLPSLFWLMFRIQMLSKSPENSFVSKVGTKVEVKAVTTAVENIIAKLS